ncbi:ABC-2 family transporter [Saccharothrix saharensis]|uniref:ABC-2 family transporter n=1 Tax=Saccharothrix saharensis TaxID=571190 RepID=A0A543JAF3_9PSEU|nr:ABC transporter permease subunit [Saccharothrix saharensis]TQM79811.1 ABC-2 family transporter [Saccharothrix saharensis]
MTWLAWRQVRFPLLSVYAALASAALVLVLTRPEGGAFDDVEFLYSASMLAVYGVPAVLGVFWGVPMITRELETGTHNLVWNQSITRTRWLAVKLGLGVPAAAVAAGLLGLVVTWWAGPVDAPAGDGAYDSRITPVVFAVRGIVPFGYAAFAFVLGVAVAILVRRTVVAMAVTLVVFAAVQVAVPFAARPYLLPPTEETTPITAHTIAGVRAEPGPDGDVPETLRVLEPDGAWVLANETLDPNGAVVHRLPPSVGGCLPRVPVGDIDEGVLDRMRECFARLSELGYRQHLAYHPASRFWPLQWLELALYLALSALLAWFCFRRLRHLS